MIYQLIAELSAYITHNKQKHEYPCCQRDSNPPSKQSRGRGPTPWKASGSASGNITLGIHSSEIIHYNAQLCHLHALISASSARLLLNAGIEK
jgi:hypothetical protein